MICSSTCNVINLLNVSLTSSVWPPLKGQSLSTHSHADVDSRVKFHHPQNISEASQQNSAAAFPQTTRPASSRSQRRDLRLIWKDWLTLLSMITSLYSREAEEGAQPRVPIEGVNSIFSEREPRLISSSQNCSCQYEQIYCALCDVCWARRAV